jgi:polar amino acid transport system substrate-binding protein
MSIIDAADQQAGHHSSVAGSARRSRSRLRLIAICRTLSIIFMPGLMALAISAPAAQPADAQAADALTVHLVAGPGFAPLSDPNLPGGGMAAEIITAAFARVGDGVTIEFEPWARGYADARDQRYDGTFPYGRTPERMRDFLFSDVVYAQVSHPYVLAAGTWSTGDLRDLTGKTMCNPEGYLMQAPIRALVDSGAIKVESPPAMVQCFKMLQTGRVDFIDCTEVQAKALAMRVFGRADMVRALPVVLGTGGSYLIVSRQRADHDRILADFNRGLALLKLSGVYDQIVQRQFDAGGGQITN